LLLLNMIERLVDVCLLALGCEHMTVQRGDL
jgi:hypothetical protein